MRRTFATVSAMVALAIAAFSGPAYAHNELTGVNPTDGSTVSTPPAEIVLTFAQILNPDAVQVAVVGSGSPPAQVSDVRVDGGTVTVPITDPVAAGTYTVSYRVVSQDGHPVSGTTSFTVAPTEPSVSQPATQSIAPATAGTGTGTGGSAKSDDRPIWPFIAAGAVFVVVIVVIAPLVGIPSRRRTAPDQVQSGPTA